LQLKRTTPNSGGRRNFEKQSSVESVESSGGGGGGNDDGFGIVIQPDDDCTVIARHRPTTAPRSDGCLAGSDEVTTTSKQLQPSPPTRTAAKSIGGGELRRQGLKQVVPVRTKAETTTTGCGRQRCVQPQ
jgi:hypothetical protein